MIFDQKNWVIFRFYVKLPGSIYYIHLDKSIRPSLRSLFRSFPSPTPGNEEWLTGVQRLYVLRIPPYISPAFRVLRLDHVRTI